MLKITRDEGQGQAPDIEDIVTSLSPADKKRVKQLLEIYNKNNAEKRYFDFFKQAWEILEPSTPLTCNWHIEYLCDVLQEETERLLRGEDKEQDIIINIPPATSKSSIVTKIWPAWVWIKDPSIRIVSGSYSLDLAKDHTVKTRDIIQSEWYQKNWGDLFQLKDDKNTQKEYANDKMGVRVGVAVAGGAATGKHYHIHIYDDPINPELTESATFVKKVIRWLSRTMANRFMRRSKGLRVLVMQRLAEDDPTGYFLSTQREAWRLIRLPAYDDPRDSKVYPPILRKRYVNNLLDPERLSLKDLAAFKVDLGSYAYSGQYDQDPIPTDGNLLKASWFRRFTLTELEEKARRAGKSLIWNFVLDGAFTEDEQNDASALMAYCEFEGCIYIRAVQSVRKELPELIAFIKEFCKANGYGPGSRIWIEPKASGMPAAQSLKRNVKHNAILDKAPTVDKVARVKGISAFVEAGRAYLLEDAQWLESFLNQITGFPHMKHDDEVDCLVIAVNRTENKKGRVAAAGGKKKKVE